MRAFRLGGLPLLDPPAYDAVVVGGGPAGLAAALVLGRSRRSVLVLDDEGPRNATAHAVHGYLGLDGIPPAELAQRARREVARYGVVVRSGQVTRLAPDPEGHVEVELADGARVSGRRVVVATGLRDELPDIPGLAERWGHDVLHCPYCHGWEVRDATVAVLATGPDDGDRALTFSQWTDRVVLVVDPADEHPLPTEELRAVGVEVVAGPVTGLDVTADRLVAVRTPEGRVPCDALVVQPVLIARDDVLVAAGAEVRVGPFGRVVVTDATGATAVPGVWAAGNVCDPQAQVPTAAAAGYRAGLAIDHDLIQEDVRRATERGPRA